ncbi:hypothetical protein PF005_g16313 [Phytophthora fragariae]|uniref:Uncharacterized protein n=1 Tax=Phytophthora fragariae TaxID=53985 RepID=A0A6A3UHG8_9STRA|nr:hypothetical protein PF003_g36894 [Phytophthora fragariae]KAE8939268.1 hypothetical protein PF009_g10884 [Phytophthora fragariae]KAE9013115.1 hypothetical protein PF011_g8617 [Phytophthora fragariae]KAE9133415.1 hypothetical protein PF007_g3364 [Phytophthora fragariae]KAE9146472.1 hypothetical protein PF006_g8757 [Phytophthora fragariae]
MRCAKSQQATKLLVLVLHQHWQRQKAELLLLPVALVVVLVVVMLHQHGQRQEVGPATKLLVRLVVFLLVLLVVLLHQHGRGQKEGLTTKLVKMQSVPNCISNQRKHQWVHRLQA